MRTALGLGLGVTLARAGGAAASGATERVVAGDFDGELGAPPAVTTKSLISPLVGGESFQFAFDVTANPNSTGIVAQLYNSVTFATQNIFSDGSTVGHKTSSGTASGAFDQMRIGASDDESAFIANVSLLA